MLRIYLSRVRNYGTIICTGEFKPQFVANFGTIKLRNFSGPREDTITRFDCSNAAGLANNPHGIIQLIDDEGNVTQDISDVVFSNLTYRVTNDNNERTK